MWMLEFPSSESAEPYTGLDSEADVLKALEDECRKVGEDGGSDLWEAPPSDSELDVYAAREAGRIMRELWPCSISESARLPDNTRVRLENTN